MIAYGLIAAVTARAAATDCFGEGSRPYRVIEIPAGEIGAPALLDIPIGIGAQPVRRSTFGMNRHLEFVFFAVDSTVTGKVRAFVHLPSPAYGLAAGTHELPVPSGAPGDGLAVVATDINDDGVIVGFVGDTVFFNAGTSVDIEAFVWRLADSTQSSPAAIQPGESIHPSSLDEIGCISGAWAINDADPPVIAGSASEAFCVPPGCSAADPIYAFRVTLDAPTSATWLKGTGSSASRAYGVSSTTSAVVAGLDLSDEEPETCLYTDPTIECPWPPDPPDPAPNHPADGVVWVSGGGGSLTTLSTLVGVEAVAAAMGIDDELHLVGDSGCAQAGIATFWEDSSASSFDLAAVCGNEAIGRAQEIVTMLACDETEELVIVVGGDAELGANLWSRVGGSSGTWCCSALEDLALPTSSSGTDGEFQLLYAHAVAPTGHIVVHGRPRGANTTHTYLLTCPADISGDGRVDGADLGLLLQNWGPCPSPGPCVANLNSDADVDGADMGLLLLAWTGTAFCQVWTTTLDCGESESFGEGDILAGFAVALAFFGFDDVSDLAAWYATASETEREALLDSITIIMLAYQPEVE